MFANTIFANIKCARITIVCARSPVLGWNVVTAADAVTHSLSHALYWWAAIWGSNTDLCTTFVVYSAWVTVITGFSISGVNAASKIRYAVVGCTNVSIVTVVLHALANTVHTGITQSTNVAVITWNAVNVGPRQVVRRWITGETGIERIGLT